MKVTKNRKAFLKTKLAFQNEEQTKRVLIAKTLRV
jgi:hypothetical protein